MFTTEIEFVMIMFLCLVADEKQFACDECDRRFIMKNRLMAHKRVVHSPKTFKCSYCSKVRSLRFHINELVAKVVLDFKQFYF